MKKNDKTTTTGKVGLPILNDKPPDFTGASKDLVELVKGCFKGDNEVQFFVCKRGNQRIEIIDRSNGEVWHTLEALEPVSDMSNFDEIASSLCGFLIAQLKRAQ